MFYGYEDWDFWVGCAERGFRAHRLPEPLFCYRVKGDSMLANAKKHHAELLAQLMCNHPQTYTAEERASALTLLQMLDEKYDEEIDSLTVEAQESFSRGALEEARTLLLQAAQKSPRNAMIRFGLGNVLWQLGQLEAALFQFSLATRVRPQLVLGWVSLAVLLRQLERFAQSESAARTALALEPENDHAQRCLAGALLHQDRTIEGARLYYDLVQKNPADLDSLLSLGKCFFLNQEYGTAREVFLEGLRRDPGHTLARENLEQTE